MWEILIFCCIKHKTFSLPEKNWNQEHISNTYWSMEKQNSLKAGEKWELYLLNLKLNFMQLNETTFNKFQISLCYQIPVINTERSALNF